MLTGLVNKVVIDFKFFTVIFMVMLSGGAVVPWLVHSSPERVVRGRAFEPGDTVLCSWARQLTLTVPLSTQEHKLVPANCCENLTNCGGISYRLASCYRNRG